MYVKQTMETIDQLRQKYLKLEAQNNHTEAAQLLVNTFGSNDEKVIMKGIAKRHKALGHITHEDSDLRYRISQKYFKNLI